MWREKTLRTYTLNALAQFPELLAANYAEVPADFRHWTPASWDGVPSEPLTAIEQLCHVRDIEIDGYQIRFQRTLTENHPLLPGLDTEALAKERAYGKADAAAVLASFTAARAKTVAMLRELSAEQLQRTADFDGYGPVTLQGLIHYLCSHDQQHLAGLQWLLGKIEATKLAR